MALIDANKDRIFNDARKAGVRESSEAYAADALAALADRPTPTCSVGQGPGRDDGADGVDDRRSDGDWRFAKVIVRVDAAALDRGEVAEGEVCEVAGQGPVPVNDAWTVIDGGALVAAITTKGPEIDRVVHLGRRPTALQRTALEWMTAGTCVIRGCDSVARKEIDHVAEWAATKRTELRELAAPCGHHHDLKTHHGYRFGPVEADGKRQLIPPDEAGASATPGSGPGAGPDPPSPVCPDPRPALGEDPPPTAGPRSIGDASSVAERARAIARSRAAHPSQRALFDTG